METKEKEAILYNNTKIWQIGLFSLNNGAVNLYMAMMLYVSYYANGVAGFGIGLISTILTLMNVFDGVTDPIAGYIVDKTNHRFGKFRPAMALGNGLMAVSCLLLYFTTHAMPGWLRFPYFILIYSIYIIGFTLQSVVGKSGQTVLTDNPSQRPVSTYFDSMFIMAAHGGSALYVSGYLVPKYGGFTNGGLFQELTVAAVGLSALCTFLAIIGIWSKDRPEFFGNKGQQQKIFFKDYWEILCHNRPIRMLVVAAGTDKLAATIYGHTAVSVMLYGIMMQDYSIAGLIGIVTAAPTLVIVTLGIYIAQRFGQKYALTAFTGFAIFFQLLLMGLFLWGDTTKIHLSWKGMNGITWLFLILFSLLNGSKSITNNMVVPMIADCSDYEICRSGKYVPGLMGALFSFIDKLFAAMGTAIVGLILILAGFGSRLPQVSDAPTEKIKLVTIFMYCIFPILGWLCSLLAMKYYKLDKKRMLEVQKKKYSYLGDISGESMEGCKERSV